MDSLGYMKAIPVDSLLQVTALSENEILNTFAPGISNLTDTVLKDMANGSADISGVSVNTQPAVQTEIVVVTAEPAAGG